MELERFPGSRVMYLGRQLEALAMREVSYRSLEHSCQRQASITSDPDARKALEEMAREYRDRPIMRSKNLRRSKAASVGGLSSFWFRPAGARAICPHHTLPE
jgi:hypothetical protein